MTQKVKKSNAGFTLVELIVVIAILGVLMAVLVPQYIQYVERSREGADRSTLSEIYHAVEIEAASRESLADGDLLTITIDNTSGAVSYNAGAADGSAAKAFADTIAKVCPPATSDMKSKAGKVLADQTITYTVDGGVAWKTAVPQINLVSVGGK